MFIQISETNVVVAKEVVGIFSTKILKNNQNNRKFIESAGGEDPKEEFYEKTSNSFVVTVDKVFFSTALPLTLAKHELLTRTKFKPLKRAKYKRRRRSKRPNTA